MDCLGDISRAGAKEAVSVLAYGKINLLLDVLGKLENGFHSIRSLIAPITLHDRVTIDVENIVSLEQDCVVCNCVFTDKLNEHVGYSRLRAAGIEDSLAVLSTQQNLAARAAITLLRLLGLFGKLKVSIEIEKAIPFCAGLGGGSADAAATLLGLSKLLGISNDSLLYQVSSELGSDISALLTRNLIFVHGTGNQIAKIEQEVIGCTGDSSLEWLEHLGLIVLKPFEMVLTRNAYAALGFPDRSAVGRSCERAPFGDYRLCEDLKSFFLDRDPNGLEALSGPRLQEGSFPRRGVVIEQLRRVCMRNSFEEVVVKQSGEILKARELLCNVGAQRVILAGSGSSMIGFFPTLDEAEHARHELDSIVPRGWFLDVCGMRLSV